MGGNGEDILEVVSGADTLDGGNYSRSGGALGITGTGPTRGNDTYLFRRGSGQDLVLDNDNTAGNLDTIMLEDINPSDVKISRNTIRGYGGFYQTTW